MTLQARVGASQLEAVLQQLARATRGSCQASNAGELFVQERPVYVARAPGRLDVMGGISDYSGALVLEQTIAEATFAVVQAQPTDVVSIVSTPSELDSGSADVRKITLPRSSLRVAADSGYAQVRALLRRDPASDWAAYVGGALAVLEREQGVALPGGLAILISSCVPEGSGVSSSAALSVATLQALSGLAEHELTPLKLATLAQCVEHAIVQAPCGIMDQVTVALGRRGKLVELLCQPASVLGSLEVPDGMSFFGIETGVRHQVSGADYTQVRTAAFMGYRIIAELEGFAVQSIGADQVRIEDPVYSGYLANLTPSRFEQRHLRMLPVALSGAEFLGGFGGTTDPATRVEPDVSYPVRPATAHPIYEHHRTCLFRHLLQHAARGEVAELLGELMFQSHESYSNCGLGSSATDQLVALLREAGPSCGVFGAKITGAGSGGTVAVLARADARAEVAKVAERYAAEQGFRASSFEGSPPGAAEFGVRRADCIRGEGRLPSEFPSVELEVRRDRELGGAVADVIELERGVRETR